MSHATDSSRSLPVATERHSRSSSRISRRTSKVDADDDMRSIFGTRHRLSAGPGIDSRRVTVSESRLNIERTLPQLDRREEEVEVESCRLG